MPFAVLDLIFAEKEPAGFIQRAPFLKMIGVTILHAGPACQSSPEDYIYRKTQAIFSTIRICRTIWYRSGTSLVSLAGKIRTVSRKAE